MRRCAIATLICAVALSQIAHAAEVYPRNAEELAAAQAQLDSIGAEALVSRMEDYFRQRLNAPLRSRHAGVPPRRDRVVPVSASLPARNARIGSLASTDALHLDIGTLISRSNVSRNTSATDPTLFSLVIEGHEYVLDVVEVVFDPVFGMQHVLAAVINTVPDACARFTLDPKSGFVAGTVTSGGQRFRLVSSDDREIQLVFRLGTVQAGADMVTTEKLVAAPIARVERRHAQAERIAAIKPMSFNYPRNGFTTNILGGAIGKLDVERLGEPEVIAQFLKELSVFTRATGDEEFEIGSVPPKDDQGRRQVGIRQLIGGIPVDSRPGFVEVGPDGDVFHLIIRVFDPSGVPTELMSKTEALKIATQEIERAVGYLGIVKIEWMSDVRLEYSARPTSQEEYGVVLTPNWVMPARIHTRDGRGVGESAVVVINAATADAQIRLNTILD